MGVDRFVALALESRGDGGEVVAIAGAGELEGALDGGSPGRCVHWFGLSRCKRELPKSPRHAMLAGTIR